MQSLPLIPLSDHHPFDRPPVVPRPRQSPFRIDAMKLVQKVTLSVTASLIVMGGQYELTRAFRARQSVPPEAAPIAVDSAALVVAHEASESTALRQIIGAVELKAAPVRSSVTATPLRSAMAPQRREQKAQVSDAMAPLPPPRSDLLLGIVEPVGHRTTERGDAIVGPPPMADARAQRPVRDAIPLPPVRSVLNAHTPAPVRLASAPLSSTSPIVPVSQVLSLKVKPATTRVPVSAVAALGTAKGASALLSPMDADAVSSVLLPMRYGMSLAAGAGDFALATNRRLLASTGDAITFFTR